MKKIGFVGIVLMSILAMFSCDPLGLTNLEVEEARLVFEGVIDKWEGKLSSSPLIDGSSISTVSTGKAEVESAKKDFTKVLKRAYPEKTLERNYKDLFDSYNTVYKSLEARLEDLENRVLVLEKDKKERDDAKISDKKADWTGLGIEDQLAFYLGWDMSGTGISIDLDLLTEKDIDKMLDEAQDYWDSSSLGERADFYTWERQHPIFDSSFNIVPQDDINEIQTYIDTEPERMEAERQSREAERQSREDERKILATSRKWRSENFDTQLGYYTGEYTPPADIDMDLVTDDDIAEMLADAQEYWDTADIDQRVYNYGWEEDGEFVVSPYPIFHPSLNIVTQEDLEEIKEIVAEMVGQAVIDHVAHDRKSWAESRVEERFRRYRLFLEKGLNPQSLDFLTEDDIDALFAEAQEYWDNFPLEKKVAYYEANDSIFCHPNYNIISQDDLNEIEAYLEAKLHEKHRATWLSLPRSVKARHYTSKFNSPPIHLECLPPEEIAKIKTYVTERHNEHWNRLEMHDKVQYYTRKRSHFYIVLDLLTPDQIDEIEAYITVYGRH